MKDFAMHLISNSTIFKCIHLCDSISATQTNEHNSFTLRSYYTCMSQNNSEIITCMGQKHLEVISTGMVGRFWCLH